MGKRVEVEKSILEKFNAEHFDDLRSAALTFADDVEITEEKIIQGLLVARKQLKDFKENMPPRTGLKKTQL